MKETIHVLFTALLSRSNDAGAPIYCRVTINSERRDFSTGIRVKSTHWNQAKQRITTKDETAKLHNERIQRIKFDLQSIIGNLSKESTHISAETVVYRYFNPEGGDTASRSLECAFNAKLEVLKKQLGNGICKITISQYNACKCHVTAFIQYQYKRRTMLLSKVDMGFVELFEQYLLTEKRMRQVSCNKVVQRFKTVIKYAVVLEWLPKDPLQHHKAKKVATDVVYLTAEELALLRNFQFRQERLSRVKDIFMFSVYTGLHFMEAISLKKEHIVIEKGERWLRYKRFKTNATISIPLLPQAEQVLKSMEPFTEDSYLLPRISNVKVNSYLKEIGEIVGIQKLLTHKVARKTFASTILLSNNVPMAIVSAMLGHSSVKITQAHYARVDGSILQSNMEQVRLLLDKDSGAG